MPFAVLMHDPLAGTLMLLALLWLSAKLGGELAVRLKLPAVTGELAVGLALTALHRTWPLFPDVAASPVSEVEFQSAGDPAALPTVGGKTTGANFSVAAGGVYPTTLALTGGISFRP